MPSFKTALTLLLEIILSDMVLYIFIFSLAVLCITLVARLLLGKDSSLKHALVSSLGIIMLYALCVIVYTFDPAGLKKYLAPLPFVFFIEDEITLFNFATADFPNICMQLLSMVILAFLVNQINSYTPPNLKPLGWLLHRSFCVCLAFFGHYLVHRIMEKLVDKVLPDQVLEFAPMILLGILIFMFLLGFIKFLIGLVLTVANPLFGGIYTFFFANKVGKNLSRSLGTTATLTVFVFALHRLGYHAFPISPEALDRYFPFAICVMILWVIIGHKL